MDDRRIPDATDSPDPTPLHGAHGHQALLEDGLRFINTLEFSRDGAEDELPSAGAALHWIRDQALMHDDALESQLALVGASEKEAGRILRKVHRVRGAMRELVEAAVERRPPDLGQLSEVNRALRTHYIYELIPAPDGVSMDHRHEGDPIDGALARLAESVAREVSQGEPERLRICANEHCRYVFADTSRTGRRKWCDMSTCGNRAKAARHRERQKGLDGVA